MQDKQREKIFFDCLGDKKTYNVFTDATNQYLIRKFIEISNLAKGKVIAELGCGSGIFSNLLKDGGYQIVSLDISHGIMKIGKKNHRELDFIQGDAEQLPFRANSLDVFFLTGMVHHFPDPTSLAKEVFRVLRPRGRFVAFDPNRRNPFMYLYRVKSSPFYSSKGVTENEQPILAREVSSVFSNAGFAVDIHYISGIKYRFVASRFLKLMLPIYNLLNSILFLPKFMGSYRAFILTSGVKQ